MTITPTRIDPRIRERRAAIARAAGRKRLRVIAVIASVVLVVGLAYLAVTSPLMDVDTVQVAGVNGAAANEVRASAEVRLHAPLMFVDTGAIARRVERLPWVAHASVQRHYPGIVHIVVTGFVPTAYIRVAGHGVLVVGDNGRVYARASAAPPHTLEIRGVRVLPAIGEMLAPAGAAGVVAKLPRALSARVRAIDIGGGDTGDAGIALVLDNGGSLRLGSADDLDAKAASALAVLARIGNVPFQYLDVSTPQNAVLRR